jgi:hypothetical protein
VWCCSFIAYCARQGGGLVSLDEAAGALHVERRRIYDVRTVTYRELVHPETSFVSTNAQVTNILEALDIVSRRTRNQYSWHGTAHIHKTIKKLLVRKFSFIMHCLSSNV